VSTDNAGRLIALLSSVGAGNAEIVNSGTAVSLAAPSVANVSVLSLTGVAPVITVPAPAQAGSVKTIFIIQDATARVPSWAGATINWQKGSAPTISTTASAVDVVELTSLDGTTWEGEFILAPSAAYTKTYNTPARTIAAATAAAIATTSAALTSYGFAQAQADSIPVAINALVADNLNLRQLIVALVQDLEQRGLLG
jgi:hypothetical protein